MEMRLRSTLGVPIGGTMSFGLVAAIHAGVAAVAVSPAVGGRELRCRVK